MFFDPTLIYEKLGSLFDPHKRIQKGDFPIDMFFPKIEGLCACGCGKVLSGRRTVWASSDCSNFAYDIRAIILGYSTYKKYVWRYFGKNCIKCGTNEKVYYDHIIPVKHGGGSCWLSNFQPLCKLCHNKKTNEDFGWKEFSIKND